MKKGKITYLEYQDNKKVNEIKRICKFEEKKDCVIFEFLIEKKDIMRLLVYKNNDIISIIRRGSIQYEIKHQQNIQSKFMIEVSGSGFSNTFEQEVSTKFIDILKTEKYYKLEIIFNRNNQDVRSVYKIERK